MNKIKTAQKLQNFRLLTRQGRTKQQVAVLFSDFSAAFVNSIFNILSDRINFERFAKKCHIIFTFS